ncbi:MAG: asparagine synthase-related protein [Actinomycetota bacterium]
MAWPSVIGEFGPACPWTGASRADPPSPWPSPDPSLTHLLDAFEASVVECAADQNVLAVAVSGGLDSLAVLVAADEFCRRNTRRLIALNVDLVDDRGLSTGALVRRQIAHLGLRCQVEVLSGSARPACDALWHSAGPRLDALPRLNRLLSDQAARRGADVLLTGEGADELLGTHGSFSPRCCSTEGSAPAQRTGAIQAGPGGVP